MKIHTITFVLAFLVATISFAQLNNNVGNEIKTSIEFDENQFDFGTVTEGDKVNYIYRFTNTGDKSLLITNAKGSCGCTVPEWPKNPIAPGEQGIIEVQFDTKGKSGRQSKRVTITANTDPAKTFLTITGEVQKKESIVLIDETIESQATIPKTEIPIMPETEIPTNNWEKPISKDCFAIFPNPTTDVLKLELKEYLGKQANVTIFNSTGQKMMSRVINEISGEILEFQVDDYAAGTYYVNIQVGKEAISTKCFVVARN